MELKDKLAIVTGGGHGIGRGIVECLISNGARVVVVQRRPLDADLVALGVIGIQGDLTDAEALPGIVGTAVEELGGVDILVNNAGMMFERAATEVSVAEWDLMMSLNLRAPMFLAQAAVPHLRKRGGGVIINIGSIEGIAVNPDHTAYSTAKAGLHALTKALAVDLGTDHIRCNAIAPGWIETDLSSSMLEGRTVEQMDALTHLHPVGRLGQPTDIGELAVFLASERSGFINGETIVIDGGRTARLPLPF